MVRPARVESGYVMPDGSLVPDLTEYLLAWVRERYALGMIDADRLEPHIEAALRGDYATATGSPFPPGR